MDDMEIVEEKDLKRVLQKLANFKEGAYIYLTGAVSGRMTFHRFTAKLDKQNSKIIIEDLLKNDIINIDLKYVSLIRKSANNKKLELQLDSDNEDSQTILFEI